MNRTTNFGYDHKYDFTKEYFINLIINLVCQILHHLTPIIYHQTFRVEKLRKEDSVLEEEETI